MLCYCLKKHRAKLAKITTDNSRICTSVQDLNISNQKPFLEAGWINSSSNTCTCCAEEENPTLNLTSESAEVDETSEMSGSETATRQRCSYGASACNAMTCHLLALLPLPEFYPACANFFTNLKLYIS